MEELFQSLSESVSEECFNDIIGIVEDLLKEGIESLSEGTNLKKIVQNSQSYIAKKYPIPRMTGRQIKENPTILTQHPNYIRRRELLTNAENTPETSKEKGMSRNEKGTKETRTNQFKSTLKKKKIDNSVNIVDPSEPYESEKSSIEKAKNRHKEKENKEQQVKMKRKMRALPKGELKNIVKWRNDITSKKPRATAELKPGQQEGEIGDFRVLEPKKRK